MALTISTAPTIEPITVAELKQQCRIDNDDADDLLLSYIVAARGVVESRLRRQLITATWRLNLDRFPSWCIDIPLPPLLSITSVQYLDSDGTTQTLASSEYTVDIRSEPGRLTPAYGKSWPTTRDQVNAVTILYTAGYGDTRASVPQGIRQAIRLLAAHYYEMREPIVTGTIVAKVPETVDALIQQYRLMQYV